MWTLRTAKAQGGICDRALGYLANTHLHSWCKDSLNDPPNESHLSRKPGSGRKGLGWVRDEVRVTVNRTSFPRSDNEVSSRRHNE